MMIGTGMKPFRFSSHSERSNCPSSLSRKPSSQPAEQVGVVSASANKSNAETTRLARPPPAGERLSGCVSCSEPANEMSLAEVREGTKAAADASAEQRCIGGFQIA